MSLLADIPKYGFGTAFSVGKEEGQISEEEFRKLLDQAIKRGCRHFDCAPLYKTQHIVGSVIAKSIQNDNISRKDFFLTSKLPVNMMTDDLIEQSLRSTLKELQVSYLDCFLIHAPFAMKFVSCEEVFPLDREGNLLLDETEGLLERCWQKLVDLKKRGLVRYVGLSNVNLSQLDRCQRIHQVDVVQNEYHLYNQDREFFDYCEEIDVHYEAYAAFGCPPKAKQMNIVPVLKDCVVSRIANSHGLTHAQVIIQWLHQQPLSYVIRTDNVIQLEENLSATKRTTIAVNDMIDLDSVNRNARIYLYDNFKRVTEHREYPFRQSQASRNHNRPNMIEAQKLFPQVTSSLMRSLNPSVSTSTESDTNSRNRFSQLHIAQTSQANSSSPSSLQPPHLMTHQNQARQSLNQNQKKPMDQILED